MPQTPTDLQDSKLVVLSPMNITDDQIVIAQAKIDNIEALNVKHNFLVDEAQVEFNAIKDSIDGINSSLTFDLDAFNVKMTALITLLESPDAGILSAFDELYDELNRRSEVVTVVANYALSTGVLDLDLTDNALPSLSSYEISATVYGQNLVDVRVEKISTTQARAYVTDGKKIQSLTNTALPYDGTAIGDSVNVLFELIRVPVQITKTFAPDVDGGDEWIAGQGDTNFVPNVASPTLSFSSIVGLTGLDASVTASGLTDGSQLTLRTAGNVDLDTAFAVTGTTHAMQLVASTQLIYADLLHGELLHTVQTIGGEESAPSNTILYTRADATSIVTPTWTEGEAMTFSMAGAGSVNVEGYNWTITDENNGSLVVANGTIPIGSNFSNDGLVLNMVSTGTYKLSVTTPFGHIYSMIVPVNAAADGGNAL